MLGIDLRAPNRLPESAVFRRADVRNGSELLEALQDFRPVQLVHLAARTDLVKSPSLAEYSTNTIGVQSVLSAIARSTVERAVFASSRLVFAPTAMPRDSFDYSPDTDYGLSKVEGELRVRDAAANLSEDLILARPTSIWGPYFGIPYALFFESVVAGRYVHPRHMKVHKSFGYVENICLQILQLLGGTVDVDGRPVWLTDPKPLEIAAFANAIRAASRQRPVRQIPALALKGGAVVGDMLKRVGLESVYPLTSSRLRNLTVNTVYDNSFERKLFNEGEFVSASAGILRTLEWLDSTRRV